MKYFIVLMLLIQSIFAQQLEVQANYFESDKKMGKALFRGNVKIKKGYDTLQAQQVEIFTNKQRIPYKYIAIGNVKFQIEAKKNERYKGFAQKVVYYPLKKEYYFYKNVKIHQLDSSKLLQGEEVFIDVKNGKSYAKSSKKYPVYMKFDLKEK